MKIKMKTLQAGPDGVRLPDHIYPVPDAEARVLITGGYAVEVKEAAEPVSVQASVEEEAPEEVTEEAPKIERADRSSRSGSRKAVKST
jgi:hypothetical protein